jgi:hypothetical protein
LGFCIVITMVKESLRESEIGEILSISGNEKKRKGKGRKNVFKW